MHRVILCARTSRVIYFTDSESAALRTTEHTYLATFDNVPADMTLLNCWDYAYRNGVALQHFPGAQKVKRTLYEVNLEESLDQLTRILKGVVQRSLDATQHATNALLSEDTVREIAVFRGVAPEVLLAQMKVAAAAHVECVNAVEHNRAKFSALLLESTTSAQLSSIRDVFANKDLSKKAKV